MKSMTAVLGVVLLVCACGAPPEGGGDDAGLSGGGGGGGGGGGDATVNGVPASQFYDQFTHEAAKREAGGAGAFPAQSNGDNMFHAAIYLYRDGRFFLFYKEGEGEVTATGYSGSFRMDTAARRTGTWSLQGATLKLGSLMSCSGMSFNGKDVLRCTVDSAVITPAAVGRSATLRLGISESTPDDSQWADYR